MRMLLSYSQVSVAASSAVVFFFTAALFLSGYAIQQRTLRNLREAIRPRPAPSPMIFLPDRFRESTTELADGTIVAVEAGAQRGDGEARRPRKQRERHRQPKQQQQQQHVLAVEIRPTVADEDENGGGRGVADALAPLAQQQRVDDGEAGEAGEAAADSTGPQPAVVYGPAEKPVSRAERRRLIREEIKRLSHADQPVYYQRRLW